MDRSTTGWVVRAVQGARRWRGFLLGLTALVAIYLTSLHSYLLFHSLAEMFSVVVAASVFVLAWNTRRLYENGYLLFVGIAYGFIGVIDLLHTLAYKGMGVFIGFDANLSTQLWIAARAYECSALLMAPSFLRVRVRPVILLLGNAAVAAVLLLSIFAWHIFPVCYVDRPGGGLTPFKITMEYVISGLLVGALLLLWRQKDAFDRWVLRQLSAAIVLTIAAELAFTTYVSVFAWTNMLGHFLKLISFFFIYRAIVETGLTRPHALLFRELKQREEALRASEERRAAMTQFIVHDLRSPLTVIVSGIATLRNVLGERAEELARQLLDGAAAAASWMMTLTEALLDAGRLESVKAPLQIRELDVRELIESAAEQVSLTARLNAIEVRSRVDGSALTALADRALTLRVLVNLLGNAVKYSPSDSTVTVHVAPVEDGMLAFSIADQGPGIPPEWQHKVFERFGQVEARQAGVSGSGLGLHFCKLAVEAQGGRIHLDSEVDRGTTITFTLPMVPG